MKSEAKGFALKISPFLPLSEQLLWRLLRKGSITKRALFLPAEMAHFCFGDMFHTSTLTQAVGANDGIPFMQGHHPFLAWAREQLHSQLQQNPHPGTTPCSAAPNGWRRTMKEPHSNPQYFPFPEGLWASCWHCSNTEITILSWDVTHSSSWWFTAVTKLFPQS